jgi:hypothetical protein
MVLRRVKKAVKVKKTVTAVPVIDRNEVYSRIQQRAYDLYEKRGYSCGNDWSDWFVAEQEVKSELNIR